MTRVVKTRGKVCEEILQVIQDIRSVGMAKCLFKQPKHGCWNIGRGDSEYFHRFACKHPIGCCSLAGLSIGGVTTVLMIRSKYHKKLSKVTKLVDIVTSAIAVFETSMSKALSNGEIAE